MTIFMAGSVLNEIEQRYIDTAEQVMEYINQQKDRVICCADERGIIGKMYQKLKGSNRLILTVPKIYLSNTKQITHKIQRVTKTINQRTDFCIQEADVLVFFPGGIGTIYEMFSCLETKKGGEHHKPILIVNYFGYYDKLVQQIEKGYQENFIEEKCRNMYNIANTSEEVISYLEQYRKNEELT